MMGDNQQRLAHAQITDSNFPTKYFVLLQTTSHNNLELFWTLLNLVRSVKVVAGGGGGESGGRECAVYSFDLLVHAWKYSETPYEKKTEILAWCGFCAQYIVSPCDKCEKYASNGSDLVHMIRYRKLTVTSNRGITLCHKVVPVISHVLSSTYYCWLYMHISRKQEKKVVTFFCTSHSNRYSKYM